MLKDMEVCDEKEDSGSRRFSASRAPAGDDGSGCADVCGNRQEFPWGNVYRLRAESMFGDPSCDCQVLPGLIL
jgi:hypothetical protein